MSYNARCHEEFGGVCAPHDQCGGKAHGSCDSPPGAVCCTRGDVTSGFRAAQQWLYAAEVADRAAEPVATLWLLPADTGRAGARWALWPQPAAAGFSHMAAAVLLRAGGPPAVDAPSQRVLPPSVYPYSVRDTRLPLLLDLAELGLPEAALPCDDPAASLDLAVYAGAGTDDRPGYAAGEDWATCADPALANVPTDCTNATLFVRLLRGVQRYGQRCALSNDCPGQCAPSPAPDASTGLCMPGAQCAAVGGHADPRPAACGPPDRCARAVCCLPDTAGVRALLRAPAPVPSPPAAEPAHSPAPVARPPAHAEPEPVPDADGRAATADPGSTARAILLWLLVAGLLLCAGCVGSCAYRCVRRRRMRAVRDAPVEMSVLAEFHTPDDDADGQDWRADRRAARAQVALVLRSDSSSSSDPSGPGTAASDDGDDDDDDWTELATLTAPLPRVGEHRATARV